MNRRAFSVGLVKWCVVLAFSSPALSADGLMSVAHVQDTPQTRVIDTRDVAACEAASLPTARCLPMNNFVDGTGNHIGFHALRWLLGTVGLRGSEHVLVIGASPAETRTVGTLLYQAGQMQVSMLNTAFVAAENAPGGETRSMSREVVFTAPMRGNIDLNP